MKDRLRFNDGCEMKLECGHPNTYPGQTCPHCGVILEAPPKEIKHEQGQAGDDRHD